jgi:hypothetical protein
MWCNQNQSQSPEMYYAARSESADSTQIQAIKHNTTAYTYSSSFFRYEPFSDSGVVSVNSLWHVVVYKLDVPARQLPVSTAGIDATR